MSMETSQRHLVFIGSYAEAASSGIYVCTYDPKTGGLTLTDQVAGFKNPTFLDTDAARLKLYALCVETDAQDQRYGAAAAFDIDPLAGKLSFLNKEMMVSAPTCHLTLDQTGCCLMAASYHGGMIGLVPVLADGKIGLPADVHQHAGTSILPVQDRPRPHSIFLDNNNRYAVVCDLGADQIVIYKLDTVSHKLIPHGVVAVTPGSGPRHFVFHPTLPYGYVIHELNATITAFSYDAERGTLSEIQTVSTLPKNYQGDNACADIHISPDGLFLYGSNRGHDSIIVLAIDAKTGRLDFVQIVSTQGEHPRNFAISPDGRFLLAANRDTNNIVTFARDTVTGKLTPNGHVLEVSKPVCVKFLK